MELVFCDYKSEQIRGCLAAETPIGVILAGGQFDLEGEMRFAVVAMKDLFKNLMIWCKLTH